MIWAAPIANHYAPRIDTPAPDGPPLQLLMSSVNYFLSLLCA